MIYGRTLFPLPCLHRRDGPRFIDDNLSLSPLCPLFSLARAASLRAVGVEDQLEMGSGARGDVLPDHDEQGCQAGFFDEDARPWCR